MPGHLFHLVEQRDCTKKPGSLIENRVVCVLDKRHLKTQNCQLRHAPCPVDQGGGLAGVAHYQRGRGKK